jgi:hypothetical protein
MKLDGIYRSSVIPAQAGIQATLLPSGAMWGYVAWIPAFAGMTNLSGSV